MSYINILNTVTTGELLSYKRTWDHDVKRKEKQPYYTPHPWCNTQVSFLKACFSLFSYTHLSSISFYRYSYSYHINPRGIDISQACQVETCNLQKDIFICSASDLRFSVGVLIKMLHRRVETKTHTLAQCRPIARHITVAMCGNIIALCYFGPYHAALLFICLSRL